MSNVAKLERPPAEPPEVIEPLALLRKPFPAHQISKLPKESRKQIDERKAGNNAINNCPVCGGWHHKNAVHLDYVGHAAATDRLLDADLRWTWEPLAYGPDGLPAFDRNGGLWIKLTVDGVTRIGYGSADGKTGGDAIKEIIGDALRNGGMRFGMALDLWHKGQLHAHDEAEEAPPQGQTSTTKTTGSQAPQTPTLDQRAAKVESAMRAQKTEADLRKTWALASKLCADLSADAPGRLTQMEDLYADLLAQFAPPPQHGADSILDDEIPF